jgi:hypothetical protein
MFQTTNHVSIETTMVTGGYPITNPHLLASMHWYYHYHCLVIEHSYRKPPGSFVVLLVLSREWMVMGEWDDYY